MAYIPVSAALAVTDGASAAVNLAAGAAMNVTPGAMLSLLPQSPYLLSWTITIKSDAPTLDGVSRIFAGPIAGSALTPLSLQLPQAPCTITVFSDATDGVTTSRAQNTLYCYPRTGQTVRSVTYVQTQNQGNLAAANCNADGMQPSAGDTVLLVGQSNLATNGPYAVSSPVTANVAALVRPPDYSTGQTIRSPVVFEAAAGGLAWGSSTWRTTSAGPIVVDSTPVTLYPRVFKGTIANVNASNAAANVTGQWLASNVVTIIVTSNAASASTLYVSANVGGLLGSGYFTVAGSANAAGTFIGYN